jgi:hypothetical protein
MQPCGHSGIYIKCVDAIYLCPTCFEVITNARIPLVPLVHRPIEVSQLKPTSLAQAFNSCIVPKMECNQKKLSTKPIPR